MAFPTDISDTRLTRYSSIQGASNLDGEVGRFRISDGAQSRKSHIRGDREPAGCVVISLASIYTVPFGAPACASHRNYIARLIADHALRVSFVKRDSPFTIARNLRRSTTLSISDVRLEKIEGSLRRPLARRSPGVTNKRRLRSYSNRFRQSVPRGLPQNVFVQAPWKGRQTEDERCQPHVEKGYRSSIRRLVAPGSKLSKVDVHQGSVTSFRAARRAVRVQEP